MKKEDCIFGYCRYVICWNNCFFADPSVKLNFNGSIVNDPQAYIAGNSSAYVTVDTFAKYYGVK